MSDPDLRDPRVDRAYRELPGEEPSAEVDERIRAAARRAVGARPQSLEVRRRSWVSQWRVPLSLAASVVIVVTLTLMVQDEERPRYDVAPARAPAPAAPAAVEPAAPPPAGEAARRKDAAPAAAPTPVAPPAAPATSPMLRSAPAADAPAAAAPELQRNLETRRPVQEAPQAPAPTAGPKTPAAPVPAAAPPPPAPGSLSDSLSRERATGERPERALRSAPAAARSEQARSPEDWLEAIRRLKAQGRDADAAAELAEFRRRYPDYALPADLAR